MKTENLMIELRRKLADSSLQSNILLAAVNIVITLIVFGVTYYLPAISDLTDANSPVYSIQIILYCIGAVFGGISIFFSAKAFSHYQKTAQFDQIKLQIEEYESEKSEIQNNMKECKTSSEIISSKISNLKKQLADF